MAVKIRLQKAELRYGRLLAQPLWFKILLIICGIIAGAIYSYGWPALLLPLLLVPLIHSLTKELNYGFFNFFSSLLSFFIPFNAIVLLWFLDSNLGKPLGISHRTMFAVSCFSWIVMNLVLVLSILPVSYWLYLTGGRIKNKTVLLFALLPAFFVVAEWSRSIAFGAFLYGPGGSVGDYWNFGSFGLSAINTPFGIISRYLGMYGLSALVVVAASLIYVSMAGRQRRKSLAIFVLFAALAVFAAKASLINGGSSPGSVRYASVLQTNSEAPDYIINPKISNATENKKDLILLPEYSEVFERGFEDYAGQYVNQRLATGGTSINVSDGHKRPWYGTLEFRDNHGKIKATTTKQLLIPTGEYLPFVISAYLKLAGQDQLIKRFNQNRLVQKGAPPKAYKASSITVGPVACSGILARSIFRSLTNQGATVLTNSASLMAFNHSASYLRQSEMMAKFHAVANNRDMLQASKGAPAFAIDSSGRYILAPKNQGTALIDLRFTNRTKKTFYTRAGEWALWWAFIIIGISLIKTRIFVKI
jgi:apolipoprotein N-acyltransferase